MRHVPMAMAALLAACGGADGHLLDQTSTDSRLLEVRAARVTAVTPSSTVAQRATSFTVTGTNLAGVTFQLTDCSNLVSLGGTSTTQSFRCTPTTPGLKAGAVRSASGPLLFSFSVTVTTACHQAIVVSGAFAPSGNSVNDLDANFAAKNPIVRIEGTGNSLVATARNGETGTLTLSGASVAGLAVASTNQGFNALRVLNASQVGLSSLGPYQPLTFDAAIPTAPFDGFQFLDGFGLGFTSWVTSLSSSGNTLSFTDVFGATGTLTLNCQ